MKRLLYALVPALLLVFAGSALVAAQEYNSPNSGSTPTLFARESPTLGTYFTDPQGRTLYTSVKDTAKGESWCYDTCGMNWPAYTTTGALSLPLGVDGTLSTITRKDGTVQVTYNDQPLYYFKNDKVAGDTTGQGVKNWFYIATPGSKLGDPAPTTDAKPTATKAAAPGSDVTVSLTDLYVNANAYTFQAGQSYTFSVTNNGAFEHEFIIEPVGDVEQPLEVSGQKTELEHLQPGDSKTLQLTFPKAGTFQIACHEPGHYEAGMVLTITVTS